MRIILLMALFSAFFASAAFEHPSYPGYVFVGAGGDVTTKYFPVDGGGWFNTPGEAFDARFPNYCQDWAKCEVLSGDVVSAGENRVKYTRNVKVWQMCQHGLCNPRTKGASIELIVDETFVDKCPPPTAPSFEMGPVEIDGTKYCGKIKSHCPEPTDDDPFTFGTGQQRTVCYDNADGTQCRIETDETGGYYHPNAYGSQEPTACREPEPPEPPDCDPNDPNCDDTDPPPPTDCEPNDPNCDDGPITDPPDCEPNDPNCDDGPITDPPDCEPNDPNCDDGPITDPPDCEPNDPNCDDGPPTDCEPDDPNCEPCVGLDCGKLTQGGKQGGLNDLFKTEDIEELKKQIEEQLEANTAQLERIEFELSQIIDVAPSLSASYQDRTLNLYGENIDISVARFQSFYQMLAAPLMLIAVISAMFILLRERHD
ncbi:hypothetical protein [Pseudoalteromonas sp. NJ631]|uniref:hypothetical protein n=1 Tax=Pseudoalteromonas sp. NJ631 TaxID=493915 RepID=UPI0002ED4B2E|nr:hypothetical protein [Pseudoalteromonas sp. NJ631]